MANKKRSVEVTETKWVPIDGKRTSSLECTETAIKGLFHQWGTEIAEGENEVATATVGIVEDTKGQIHLVPPSWIKFIN